MIKKSLIIGMVSISMIGMSQTQCNGLTKDSIQCKNITKSKTELCYLHDKMYVKDDKMSQKCKGTTKKNKSCKNKTKNESGLCYRHEEN
tara:strand:+ start:112 stop:378 length:267 start_codon:yes stop_codon:yes gene_type:complete